MCGIFGVAPFRSDHLEKARQSLDRLSHRGPDQTGEWYDRQAYLGHRRLSILDLSEAGRQPMVSPDQSLVLTANGEIYNYLILKQQLMGRYEFRSRSDCEVLLHGYAEWGVEGLLDRIDGMFAFTILDKKKNVLYLVRDRVGIKPLYYYYNNGRLVWSSELRSIQTYFGSEALNLDTSAVCDFYTYNYIPSPKTVYTNVFKLKPAHYLTFDLNHTDSVSVHKYWQIPEQEMAVSFSEAKEHLKMLIAKSVREQMMSDVPLGFFLSGGLDSSTVVASAGGLSDKLTAYAIGFDESHNDETGYAQIVADRFGVKLQKKILSFEDAEKLLPKVMAFYDEPFADLSAIPTHCVSAFARNYVTVALTGDGGDEIFGGYSWYRYADHEPLLSSVSIKKLLSVLRARSRYSVAGRLANRIQSQFTLRKFEKLVRCQEAYIDVEKAGIKSILGLPEDYEDYWYYKENFDSGLSPRKALQRMDFLTYLPDDILTKVDRASMAVALEARVPLLSREIIEFAFSLPESVIYHEGQLKSLMKSILSDLLPKDFVHRPKKGFSIPLRQWSRKGLFDQKTYQEYILNSFLSKHKI